MTGQSTNHPEASGRRAAPVEPRLSVVIVSWNARFELERCLTSLFAHTRAGPLEVIVVDNGSTDGSAAVARRRSEVQLIENPDNRGAGGGRNQGLAASTGELVLLLDCDTYVVDDVIDRAVALLDARPDVAVLGCELRFPDGRRQYSAHRAMSIRHTLLRDLWLYRLLPPARRARELLGGYYDDTDEVLADWLAAPFIMLRRSVYERCGGFNERLFPEDSEWGIRVSRAGNKVLYAPQLGFVFHTGSTAVGPDRERVMLMHHGAGLQAYRLLNGRLASVAYWTAELCGAAIRWAVYGAAAALRPANGFYRDQRDHHRLIVETYLRIARFW